MRQERKQVMQGQPGNKWVCFPFPPWKECMRVLRHDVTSCHVLYYASVIIKANASRNQKDLDTVVYREIVLCTRKAAAQMHWQAPLAFVSRVLEESCHSLVWGGGSSRKCVPPWMGQCLFDAGPLLSRRNDQGCQIIEFPTRRGKTDFHANFPILKSRQLMQKFLIWLYEPNMFVRQVWFMGYHFAPTLSHLTDFLVLTHDTEEGLEYLLTE